MNLVERTEEARCKILSDAEEALAALGIHDSWECLAVGAMMGLRFEACAEHYREAMQRIADYAASELERGSNAVVH